MFLNCLNSFAQTLSNVSKIISSKLFILAIIATGLMAIPTALDIVGILTFGNSIPGVIEFVEFMQSILVFASLAYVHNKTGHIYVEMFIDKMSLPFKNAFQFIFLSFATILFSILTYRTFLNAITKWNSSEISYVLHIPIAIFIFFAALGLVIAACSFLTDTLFKLIDMLINKQYLLLILACLIIILGLTAPFWLTTFDFVTNKLTLGAVSMLALLCLLLLGMPIGIAMLGIGFLGVLVLYPTSLPAFSLMGSAPYSTASTYIYTVVPMFILMGELAMYSGISKDLFNTANIWFAKLPGGLAIASVTGCAGFAAVSGDSMATAVTMASVALPEMESKKYNSGFACATLAAGGTLGILIPPSTGFIFYSLVTEVSIGKLFLAGIIPGLILTAIFFVIIIFYAKKYPDLLPARQESSSFKEKFSSLGGILPMLMLIILVLGGILGGFFSPNQGGAIGAVGTYLYALVRRRISFKNLIAALSSTALITAKLMLILIGVGILGNFFAATRLPFELANLISSAGASKFVVFCAFVVAYMILGCMINVIPMILLTLPAIFPTIMALGFDPVWFGVIVVILMEMGQITPPVGINVFAISTVATNVPMMSIFHRIIPFFFGMLILVFILYFFPSITTFLPNLFFS